MSGEASRTPRLISCPPTRANIARRADTHFVRLGRIGRRGSYRPGVTSGRRGAPNFSAAPIGPIAGGAPDLAPLAAGMGGKAADEARPPLLPGDGRRGVIAGPVEIGVSNISRIRNGGVVPGNEMCGCAGLYSVSNEEFLVMYSAEEL